MACVQPNLNQTASSKAFQKRVARQRGCDRGKIKVTQSYWAAEQKVVDTGVAIEDRQSLLRRYGDFTLAYSTAVQPRLFHFGDENGYVAHRSRWGITCALGDPVCDGSFESALIQNFVEEYRRPMFCQVSRSTAQVLSQLGYYINPMGVDTSLTLDQFTLAGKKKEWLRYAGNWVKRRGYTICEASYAEVQPKEVESISEAWRETRTIKQKEVRFLNRPIVLEDEPDVRKFYLIDPKGRPVAFVFLDPLYRDSKVFGYATSFKRRHPDAPQYGEQAIMRHIMEQLKGESVEVLNLGLSPLVPVQPIEFRGSQFTDWLFRRTFSSRWVNRHFYHLAGHADYKRRFHGTEETFYLALPTGFSPRRLMALLALTGIF